MRDGFLRAALTPGHRRKESSLAKLAKIAMLQDRLRSGALRESRFTLLGTFKQLSTFTSELVVISNDGNGRKAGSRRQPKRANIGTINRS